MASATTGPQSERWVASRRRLLVSGKAWKASGKA